MTDMLFLSNLQYSESNKKYSESNINYSESNENEEIYLRSFLSLRFGSGASGQSSSAFS